MATMIDTIFVKGAFQPLQPVAIPENRRVRIRFDEPAEEVALPPRLSPREYLDEYPDPPDVMADYQPVPPKAVRAVTATVTAGGRLAPAPYPDE